MIFRPARTALRYGHRNYKIALICWVFVASFICYAQVPNGFSHPVERLRITSLFGESRGDHFHTGVDYAIVQPVKSIGEGTVIFIRDHSVNPHLIYLGTGNSVIIEHDNGIRSHYHHLKGGSIPLDNKKVDSNSVIGIVGNSGYSIGAHLHLDIEAAEEQKLLNPLDYLPTVSDTSNPQVVSLLAKINEKVYRLKKRSFFRYQGEMELFSIGWDQYMIKNKRVNPRRIELWVDDNKTRELNFDFIEKKDGMYVLSSGQSFYETYGLDFNYRLGDFLPKKSQHDFTIRLWDNAGKQSSRTFSVSFR